MPLLLISQCTKDCPHISNVLQQPSNIFKHDESDTSPGARARLGGSYRGHGRTLRRPHVSIYALWSTMLRVRQPRVVLHTHTLVNTVTEFAAGSERYLYARADDLGWVRRAQRARHDHIRQGRTSFSCTVVHARPSFATRRRLYSYV